MLGWLPTVATVVRRTPGRDREAVDGYATKQSIRFVKRTYRASAGAKPGSPHGPKVEAGEARSQCKGEARGTKLLNFIVKARMEIRAN